MEVGVGNENRSKVLFLVKTKINPKMLYPRYGRGQLDKMLLTAGSCRKLTAALSSVGARCVGTDFRVSSARTG